MTRKNRLLTMLPIPLFMTLAACRPDATVSESRAFQGVPDVYAGIYSGAQFEFYEMANGRPVIDTTTGRPKIRHATRVSMNGATLSAFAADGKTLGPDLVMNPNVTFSFLTNTLWTCESAHRFVGRTAPLAPGELPEHSECYIEVTTTGDSGIAVTIIGLPKGQGMLSFVNANKPKLVEGKLRAPTDSPATLEASQRVNAKIDKAFALKAMQDIASAFGQNSGSAVNERNTCLKNQRAFGWTDLQAHYYCQLPLSPVRNCYAHKLVEVNDKLVAGTFDPHTLDNTMCQVADVAKTNPFCVAYDACLKDNAFFKNGNDAAEHFSQFRYIMFTRTGALDFNIEEENEVINAFYNVKDADPASPTFDGNKRPRRLLDTYPYWLPDQPRYNKIRALQLDTQTKLGLPLATPAGQ